MIIREVNKNDLLSVAKVQVESNRTTYKGIMPEEYLNNLSYKVIAKGWDERLFNENRKEFMYIAETDEGEIVGFVSANLERVNDLFEGEVSSIYILKEYQRKGIGKLLIKEVVLKFMENSVRNMILWTLEKNPSRLFYEHLGGKIVGERIINRGGKELQQFAYVWEDIDCLL
ncbi:MAG: GNAT family N-acetyltransferase [Clostridia bacterium]|nr:GNAT family N-acetyltransferase [Clostridia bacterium]